MREKYWHLTNRPLLTPLNVESLRQLEKLCRVRTYAKGSPLSPPQQNAGGILLVLDGEVKLTNTSLKGNTSCVAILEPGDVAGELTPDNESASSEPPFNDFLVVSRPATVAYLPPSAAHSVFSDEHIVRIGITKRIGLTRFRIDLPWTKLLFCSTRRRLDLLFQDLRMRLGYQLPDYSTELGVRLTVAELAHIVGSSTVAVSRALRGMQASHHVRYRGARVVLTKRQAA